MKKIPFIFICCSLIAGCHFEQAHYYRMSRKNIGLLHTHQGNEISVGDFSDIKSSRSGISCRWGIKITLPHNQTYDDYIKNALISELGFSQILNPDSSLVLSGVIEKIDLETTVPTGTWDLKVKIKDRDGQSFYAESSYKFSVNLGDGRACQQAAQAFEPAIQDLIYAIISSKGFKQYFKEHNKSPDAH